MDVATPILINMFSAFAGIPIQIQCILLQYSHVAQVALIMWQITNYWRLNFKCNMPLILLALTVDSIGIAYSFRSMPVVCKV